MIAMKVEVDIRRRKLIRKPTAMARNEGLQSKSNQALIVGLLTEAALHKMETTEINVIQVFKANLKKQAREMKTLPV